MERAAEPTPSTRPYKRIVEQVKKEEEAAQVAIAAAVAESRSASELGRRLVDIGESYALASDATREAFALAIGKLGSDELRSKTLRALLAEAKISENKGRAILEATGAIGTADELLEVLSYMHRIVEDELVRGPLWPEYLEAASRLQGDALASALEKLLHPNRVPAEATVAALKLATRIRSEEGRAAVLTEVVDHQELTQEVEAAYVEVMRGLTGSRLDRAEQRLQQRTRGADREARATRHVDREVRVNRALPLGYPEDARSDSLRLQIEALQRAQITLQQQAEALSRQAEGLARDIELKMEELERSEGSR